MSDDVPGWLRQIDRARPARTRSCCSTSCKTNAYKFSWALIPISVPFVWLLFPFSRRFRLYDHTVFVTYSLCFMTLLVVAGSCWSASAGASSSRRSLFFIPPFHMYRQLGRLRARRASARSGGRSLLTIFAFIAVGLFIVAAGRRSALFD